jgi:hypothetical protein
MAGRPFGTYDTNPFRSAAGVDPFSTFVQNGMRPLSMGTISPSGPPVSGTASKIPQPMGMNSQADTMKAAQPSPMLMQLLSRLLQTKRPLQKNTASPNVWQQILAMLQQGNG